jgi:hypothetical protein
MAPVSNLQGSRQFGMVVRISEMRLLTAMAKEETFAEAPSVRDSYVEVLKTEAFETRPSHRSN